MNIHKLLAGILLTICVVVLGPYLFAYFHLMPPLSPHAWIILLVATSGLIVKLAIGDVVAGEFVWHKFGYDNCIMAFGAILSAFALQLVTGHDLFPGLSAVPGIGSVPSFAADPAKDRSIQLFIGLFIALVCTMITGSISGAIKKDAAKGVAFLSLVNAFIGLLVLACYVLTLVAKG